MLVLIRRCGIQQPYAAQSAPQQHGHYVYVVVQPFVEIEIVLQVVLVIYAYNVLPHPAPAVMPCQERLEHYPIDPINTTDKLNF